MLLILYEKEVIMLQGVAALTSVLCCNIVRIDASLIQR